MNFNKKVITSISVLIFFLISLGSIGGVKSYLSISSTLTEKELEEKFELKEKSEVQKSLNKVKIKFGGDSSSEFYSDFRSFNSSILIKANAHFYSKNDKLNRLSLFILFCCLKIDC